MTRKIKRIAATIIAGILLVCVSFASFAEEAEEILDENGYDIAETDVAADEAPVEEAVSVEEAGIEDDVEPGQDEDPEPEAPDTDAGTETTVTEEENGETQEVPAENETEDETAEPEDSSEEYYEFSDEDDIEYEDLSDDAGYIDQAVVQQFIPEITEELIASSEMLVAGDAESEAADDAEEESNPEEESNIEEEKDATAEDTAETETAESVAVRAWITTDSKDVFVGDVLKLKANAQPELSGNVTWEIRNELWDKDVWKEIETGRTLELEVTAENASDMIRFITEDGIESEIFRINAAERTEDETVGEDTTEETVAEDTTEATTAEEVTEENGSEPEADTAEIDENRPESEIEEQDIISEDDDTTDGEIPGEGNAEVPADDVAEGNADETADMTDDESGEAAETETEEADETETEEADETETEEADDSEEAAAEIHAWITVTENEDGTVILNANADPELTGVNTWQTWNEENGKWQKIGYGDQAALEAAEGQYRFVMQDGTVSEIWQTAVTAPDAETELQPEAGMDDESETEKETKVWNEDKTDSTEVADEEATEGEEITEPALPEDRSVNVSLTWDDEHPGFGSTAHFTAELKGYEGFAYTLQWMESADNENWAEIEGASGETLDVVIDGDNYQHFWRVEVHVTGAEIIE